MANENQAASVKHINSKTAGVNPKVVVKTEKPVFMIRIFGIINDVKNFEDRNGDVKTAFLGDFAAIGPKGERFESDKCYLFKSLEEKMVSVFKGNNEKPVEFGYDISAIPDEKANTGYVYQAKTILATAASDRLAKLTETMASHAMPESGEPATEPVKATTKKK